MTRFVGSRPLTAAVLIGFGCSTTAVQTASDGSKRREVSAGVRTELGEVVLTKDLDEPFPEDLRLGEGGGLDMSVMFAEHYHPDLRLCAKLVQRASNQWAKSHHLPLVAEEVSEHRALLHYSSPDPSGFFEVIYRVYPEHRAAHAYFGFYDRSMQRLSPPSIETMIKRFALGDFVDELRRAAECSDGVSVR